MPANLLRKWAHLAPEFLAKPLINIYPPFFGAGIRVDVITRDRRFIRVRLSKAWFNMNYVGTQFGGSIYAMTDPFYMLMLMHNLGSDYIVWDKAAAIDFIKPGKSHLFADFRLEAALLDKIYAETESGQKYIFDIPVEIHDASGLLVAKVSKTLYVRRKAAKSSQPRR
jgi:acyl-coenzyme A thioesterase PaaI-like protein